MGLLFDANSEEVNHGSAPGLDNLDPFTVAFWLKLSTLQLGYIYHKATGGGGDAFRTDAGDPITLVYVRFRSSAATYYQTNEGLSADTYYFVASVFDSGAAAGEIVNIYRAALGGSLSEFTYSTATDGSGALTDYNTADVLAGNYVSGTSFFPGEIYWFGLWDVALSQTELEMQMHNIWYPSPQPGNCQIFANYGFNGTGSQTDWSGNGNHGTVTGATVAPHVPLGPLRGGGRVWEVAAPAGRTTKNTDTHLLGMYTGMSWRMPTTI